MNSRLPKSHATDFDHTARVGPQKPFRNPEGKLPVVMALTLSMIAIAYSALLVQSSGANQPTEITLSSVPAAMCQTNGTVKSILRVENTYYLGGDFSKVRPAGSPAGSIDEVDRRAFVACAVDTGNIEDWSPLFTRESNPDEVIVETILASPDGFHLYVGGRFNQVDGLDHKHVVAFHRSTGNVINYWDPNMTSKVIDMTLTSDGNILYIAGWGGVEAHWSIHGLGPDLVAASVPASVPAVNETKIEAFQPAIIYSAESTVSAVALSPDEQTLYIGGAQITNVNGVTRTAVAAIDASVGMTTTAFAPMIEDTNPSDPVTQVYRIIAHDGQIYLCGDWWLIEGQGEEDQNGRQHNAGRFDPLTGAADLNWLPWTDGGLRDCAIEPQTNSLIVGGHFVKAGGHDEPLANVVSARGLAAFSLDDATMRDWRPDIGIPALPGGEYGEVYSVHASSSAVAIGGHFLQINAIDQQSFSHFELVTQPTPTPVDTPTALPTDTPTPLPVPTDTPVPTAVEPTAQITPEPTDTPTELPAETSTPLPPTATETATEMPTPLPPTPVFECSNSNLPLEECNALITIYQEMGGTEWSNQDGWLTEPSPCDWHGVFCYFGQRNVENLYLSDNKLTGEIPVEIASFSLLTQLSLSENELSGEIIPELGDLTNLTKLFLQSTNLSGRIPAELGRLSNLETLDLGANQLSGTIPLELTNLLNLSTLHLYHNELSGEIPPELGNLTNLARLSLAQNQLTGGIPSELGNLTNLFTLSLRNNELTGAIPASLGNLTKLERLTLNAIGLSGELPPELGNAQNLVELELVGTYHLSGTFPDSFAQLTALEKLNYEGSGLCQPTSGPVYGWVDDLSDHRSSGILCPLPTVDPQGTPTPTATANPVGDAYEDDNVCGRATLAQPSLIYEHDFHITDDSDWIKFLAEAGKSYRIEAQISDGSVADLALELHEACATDAIDDWDKTFSPGIRYEFTAAQSGMHFVEFSNTNPINQAKNYDYQLSVHALDEPEKLGAVIIVAGRLRDEDSLQDNIHAVTNSAYELFQAGGYLAEDIHYLATDETLPGYDAPATLDSLEMAITEWALNRLDTGESLTLYMVDHGEIDSFYLDKLNEQTLSPVELDYWLSQVEEQIEDLKVNVIIEACHAGSFIQGEQTISKPGRVIITSSNEDADAYASREGASFSDQFITSLRQGYSLYVGWWESQISVRNQHKNQVPWIDADGDQQANTLNDAAIASLRNIIIPVEAIDTNWPPYIEDENIILAQNVNNGPQSVEVKVTDNADDITSVWAIIYPPNYEPLSSDNELVREDLETVGLVLQADGLYAANIPTLEEAGEYTIIIHAKDGEGLYARPLSLSVDLSEGESESKPNPIVTPITPTPVTPISTPEPERSVFIPIVSK